MIPGYITLIIARSFASNISARTATSLKARNRASTLDSKVRLNASIYDSPFPALPAAPIETDLLPSLQYFQSILVGQAFLVDLAMWYFDHFVA